MSMTINTINQGFHDPYQLTSAISPLAETPDPAPGVSSGYLSNQATSGVSEMAIYEKMTAQMQGLAQGSANTADMSNLVKMAAGGLTSIADSLQRIRELSLGASNGILSYDERSIIQGEIGQLLNGINNVADYTEFNGMKLLNGTFVNRNTASTPNGTGRQIAIGNMSLGGLGLTGFNVMGNFDIGRIDSAINTVLGTIANLGAISNTFGHTMNANSVAEMNLAAARSRFADTNIAKASSPSNRNRVIGQYQTLMQRNNMAQAKNVLANL